MGPVLPITLARIGGPHCSGKSFNLVQISQLNACEWISQQIGYGFMQHEHKTQNVCETLHVLVDGWSMVVDHLTDIDCF